MKWSTRMIVLGLAIFLIGFIPLIAAGVKFNSLEGAATFFATGILVLLVGLLLRRIGKTLE